MHKLKDDLLKLRGTCNDFAQKNMNLYDLRIADQIINQTADIKDGMVPMIQELSFESPAQRIAFAVYFSVINFNFSQYQSVWIHDRYPYYRSKGMMYALYDTGFLWADNKQMSSITKAQWRNQLSGFFCEGFPWAEERIEFLFEMAAYLQKEHIHFYHFFQQFPTVDDIYLLLEASQLYKDPFLKRMQMLIGWLIDIAKETNITIGDSSMLTGLADYRLPQLFYNMKLIKLSPQEQQILVERKKLQLDDAFVQKMRYSTIFLCDYLSKQKKIIAAEMDRLLWCLSQQMLEEGKLSTPAMNVDTCCF